MTQSQNKFSSHDLLKNCLQGQQDRVDKALSEVLDIRSRLKKHQQQLEHLNNLDSSDQSHLSQLSASQAEDYLLLLQEMTENEQRLVNNLQTRYTESIEQLSAEKNSLRQMLGILGQGSKRKPVRKIALTKKAAALTGEVRG